MNANTATITLIRKIIYMRGKKKKKKRTLRTEEKLPHLSISFG